MPLTLSRLLILALALWLPLKGMAGIVMPLCKADAAVATHGIHHAGTMSHGTDQAAGQADSDENPSQPGAPLPHGLCYGCSVCQECSSAALPAHAAAPGLIPASDPTLAPSASPSEHFPERLQRPPLA